MINFLKSSIQTELNGFFQVIQKTFIPSQWVTKAAFTKARAKFRAHAFIELNEHLVRFFEYYFPARRWRGMRLLAIDGSTLTLPKTPEILERYGDIPPNTEQKRPMARISQLFDVLNSITLHAAIQPYRVPERDLALSHSSSLKANDLVLLDKGYPGFWFFAWFRSESAHFFARIPAHTWKRAETFIRSGKQEQIITIHASHQSLRQCRAYGIPADPFQVRLIRNLLHNGEEHIYMTSLIDTTIFPYAVLQGLYRKRWGVEESFKCIKCRMEIANFTGKTVHAIEQDFFARIFSMNLTAVLSHPAQDALDRDTTIRKYSYQVNFTQALSSMKRTIVSLFYHNRVEQICRELLKLFQRNPEPVRPNRKFPRKPVRRDQPVFFMCYKPIA